MGDVYPKFSKLPKGEYNLQLYLRYGPLHNCMQAHALSFFFSAENCAHMDLIYAI